MKLTREEAIMEHRKMWNWIADKIKTIDEKDLDDPVFPRDLIILKREYMEESEYDEGDIRWNCFLCDYVNELLQGKSIIDCELCPLVWGDTNCTADDGLYTKVYNLVREKRLEEASELAKQIANLPEKKEVLKMELTREEAITEHRKMWNWIADKLESEDCEEYYSADYIKDIYLNHRYGEENHSLTFNCFLCEYDFYMCGRHCEYCPLDWGDVPCAYSNGLYTRFAKLIENGRLYKEAATIARQIANLPEKKEG